MAIYLNTNITSLMAQNNLNNSQSQMATAIQQLSSGLQINSAKDNAAGYAIATVMGSQLNGYAQATRNANDAISLSQTASGAMQSIVNNLQTMQSLAVQASNATYGSSNRSSMNAEFQQLSSEINRVAQSTQFNGVNLLDGTFTAQTFQIGVNNSTNDQINLSGIASMQTNALGGVGTGSLTSFTSNQTTHALAAGDLTLNGFQVGASTAGAANGQSADSAYAIANAINAVTSQTGVTATANATTVTGAGPTAGATTVSGMTINGVTIATVTGTASQSAAGAGANLAAAINASTAQTGVTATASATTGALTLTAADGRDIVVGGSVTGSGLTAATTTGTISLSSTNSNGIVVGGNNANYAGFTGTQYAGTAMTADNSFTNGQLVINGVSVGATAAGSLTMGYNNGSAYSIAQAINAVTAQSGVSATASTTATNAYTATATSGTLGVTINGTAITATAGASAGASAAALITAINAQTSTTGVSAALSGTAGITFTSTTGGDIALTAASGGTITTANTFGSVTLTDTKSNAISFAGTASSIETGGIPTFLGGVSPTTVTLAGAIGNQTTGVDTVANANVLSQASAQAAITTLQGALNTVLNAQGLLGAIQNRLTSVVSNLQTATQNLTSAQSQIQSTDFAATTATLTRTQILQQAGTAMLAQANAMPNAVLTLLK